MNMLVGLQIIGRPREESLVLRATDAHGALWAHHQRADHVGHFAPAAPDPKDDIGVASSDREPRPVA
jgi:hypothetical protein